MLAVADPCKGWCWAAYAYYSKIEVCKPMVCTTQRCNIYRSYLWSENNLPMSWLDALVVILGVKVKLDVKTCTYWSTPAHSRMHMTRGWSMAPASPYPQFFSWWRSSSLAHSGWACYLQESSGCIASPSEPAQYLLSPGPALLPRSRNIAKLFSDHKVVHIESSISFYSHNIEISLYRSYNFALTIVRHHRVKFLRVSTLYHTAYINALCIFRGHGKIFMALPSLVTNIVNERCLLLPHAWHLLSIHLLFVTEDVIIRGPSTSIASKSI